MKRLKIACEKSKRLLSFSTQIPIYVDNFYNEETLYITVTRAKFEDLCKGLFAKIIKKNNINPKNDIIPILPLLPIEEKRESNVKENKNLL